MGKMKIKANRIKPKPYKNRAYLAYMHSIGNTCLVCGSHHIELHHLKDRDILGRDDSKIVCLCPEHHRGKLSPHGFDAKKFYEEYPKEMLLKIANESFKEFKCLGL